MRQSALTSAAFSNIQKDLLTQPLQLLSGVDILGNASSALSNMSKGIDALSMDKKFIQSSQKQVCVLCLFIKRFSYCIVPEQVLLNLGPKLCL